MQKTGLHQQFSNQQATLSCAGSLPLCSAASASSCSVGCKSDNTEQACIRKNVTAGMEGYIWPAKKQTKWDSREVAVGSYRRGRADKRQASQKKKLVVTGADPATGHQCPAAEAARCSCDAFCRVPHLMRPPEAAAAWMAYWRAAAAGRMHTWPMFCCKRQAQAPLGLAVAHLMAKSRVPKPKANSRSLPTQATVPYKPTHPPACHSACAARHGCA